MKKVFSILLLIVIFAPFFNISAYGGGGGFPGFISNPVRVECHYKEHNILGYTFYTKKCEVIRDEDFKDRLQDFLERVRHGRNRAEKEEKNQ